MEIILELGAEGGVGNAVDLPLEAVLPVPDGHPRVAGPQMGMVIGPEKDVQHHIAVRDRAEKAAHYAKNSWDRVMGSMYSPFLYTRMLPEAISSMSMTSPFSS